MRRAAPRAAAIGAILLLILSSAGGIAGEDLEDVTA